MKFKMIWHELKEHIPFTLLATAVAVLLSYAFYNFLGVEKITSLFYILHPAHVFVSSIVSAAIFYKYKKNIVGGLLVGVIGAVAIGSLSDIILPWLGGSLLGLGTEFHLELIEEPVLILGVALIGSIFGIATGITKLPHFLHVLLSVFASLFYLLAFSIEVNFLVSFFVAVIVFVAVLVPCCVSDIVFPLLLVGKKSR